MIPAMNSQFKVVDKISSLNMVNKTIVQTLKPAAPSHALVLRFSHVFQYLAFTMTATNW